MTVRFELRARSADVQRWRALAAASGMTLSAWIRRVAGDASLSKASLDLLRRRVGLARRSPYP